MLIDSALILLTGLLVAHIFNKLKLPHLIGYIFIGILIGPSVLNFLGDQMLNLSAEIRQFVLIIILTRAGLSLDLKDLRKVGRPAVLLSFIPATFEVIAVMLLAPFLLDLTLIESALLGAVLAAVSPAVVVPRMIKLINEKRGTKIGIPQLILAGSSLDDVYALVLFSSFLSMNQNGQFNVSNLLEVPISILSAVIVGFISGYFLSILFKKGRLDTIIGILIMLSVSFIFIDITHLFGIIPFSGILAVMSMAIRLYQEIPVQASKIADVFNQLWIPGEIFLFVLVGASINITFAFSAGMTPIYLILLALAIRMIGVWFSLIGTGFNKKEKLFTLIAYTPKATVQAAIGGVPLAMGLPAGEIILTVSVLSILITAPLGALGIDFSYKRLLPK